MDGLAGRVSGLVVSRVAPAQSALAMCYAEAMIRVRNPKWGGDHEGKTHPPEMNT